MSQTAVASPTKVKSIGRTLLNKVPQITLFFWVIKILATTVGETAADFLATNLKQGLTKTTLIMGALLAVVLFFQFKARSYNPGIYWLAVVLMSIFGTLITDNMVDNFNISLWTSTAIFSVALAVTFSAWYASEKTLSIHSVTAAGDLVAEKLNIGYWKSALIFAAIIGLMYVAQKYLGLNAVLAFWAAYIVTRPLGASIGDYLSQDKAIGGLELGTTVTSFIFLAVILVVVAFVAVTKKDATKIEAA
jgi:uncharacterized membrane-anchored protein